MEVPVDNLKINRAVKNSNFDLLKKQEKEKGFNEKPVNAKSFFRKGIAKDWMDHLSIEQVNMIREKNYEMMKRFGY